MPLLFFSLSFISWIVFLSGGGPFFLALELILAVGGLVAWHLQG